MAKNTKIHHTSKKVYLTPEGLKEAQEELNFLKNIKRPEVAERITRAREFGDVDENAEYDAALDEQALIENRISSLEGVLRNAKIISEGLESDVVVIGSTVKVKMNKKTDEFTIVGKVEANPIKKRISNESPLGSALLGSKVGEIVEVTTPTAHYKCKILKINFSS